jgi:hypothetical protein
MLAYATSSRLESRLAELMMGDLAPCDLGDGIEVIHDVEAVEIEMDCALEDDETPDDLGNTIKFAREDDIGTHGFVRHSAPYERIEIQLDAGAYRRATIEEARKLKRLGVKPGV